LSLFRPLFVYAPNSKRLFLVGKNVLALDSENHAVDYISVREIAKSANIATVREMDSLVVLANGNLVLLTDKHRSPALILYDPVARKVLQHWTETQKYSEKESYTDSRTGKNEERVVQKIARIRCGPVASRDGSRLFAVSEGDIVLWDANTLEELSRLDAPEPPDSNSGECFHSAPDGRGLWYLGQSGKVYRLDDRTGKFIEEVKLPFHVISLIREP
jgi:WD40 repeat protein